MPGMTNVALIVIAAALALILLRRWLGRPRGVIFDLDDPDVAVAKQQARDNLPTFRAALDAAGPDDSDFMLKFDLCHGRGRDHKESIWARDIERRDGVIHGRLANAPDDPAFRQGDAVVIDPAAIDDWCFFRRNVAQGHFVTRLMIERSPPRHAAQARRDLGWSSGGGW
jgi:uncharacterized protein YegJ (DUF2314 family)